MPIDQELVEYAQKNLNHIPKGEEYKRMISGEYYNCMDRELNDKRVSTHELVLDYANIRMKDYDNDATKIQRARYEYLKGFFGHVEPDSFIEPPFFVDYGCNILVGKGFYANYNCCFLDCSLITFGDNVLIGPSVTFSPATHPALEPKLRLEGKESAKPIKVGNNVWFGANCVILPGITIGDHAVIAAGAVVSKDVPEYSVVAGVPAKVIKTVPEENRLD